MHWIDFCSAKLHLFWFDANCEWPWNDCSCLASHVGSFESWLSSILPIPSCYLWQMCQSWAVFLMPPQCSLHWLSHHLCTLTCFVSPSYDSLYVSPPHAPSLKVEERTPTWEPTTTVKIRIQYDAIDRYTCKMDNTSSPTTPIPTRAIFHVFVWDVCGGCFTIGYIRRSLIIHL